MKKVKICNLCVVAGLIGSCTSQNLFSETKAQRLRREALAKGVNLYRSGRLSNSSSDDEYDWKKKEEEKRKEQELNDRIKAQEAELERLRQSQMQVQPPLPKPLPHSASMPLPQIPPVVPGQSKFIDSLKTVDGVVNALDLYIAALNNAAQTDKNPKALDLLAHLIIWSYDLLNPTSGATNLVLAKSLVDKVLDKIDSGLWRMILYIAMPANNLQQNAQLPPHLTQTLDVLDNDYSEESTELLTDRIRNETGGVRALYGVLVNCATNRIAAPVAATPAAAPVGRVAAPAGRVAARTAGLPPAGPGLLPGAAGLGAVAGGAGLGAAPAPGGGLPKKLKKDRTVAGDVDFDGLDIDDDINGLDEGDDDADFAELDALLG
jgi:hypothetical protein